MKGVKYMVPHRQVLIVLGMTVPSHLRQYVQVRPKREGCWDYESHRTVYRSRGRLSTDIQWYHGFGVYDHMQVLVCQMLKHGMSGKVRSQFKKNAALTKNRILR